MGGSNNSNIFRLILLFEFLSKCFLITLNENIANNLIKEPKYVSIPFKENIPYYRRYPSDYSPQDFLNDFFLNNLSVDISLGTPFQKITSFLNQESSCFKFTEKMKKKIETKINKRIIAYKPKKSLTFLLKKNSKLITAEDLFLFQNEKNKNISNNIHIPFNLDIDFGEIDEETEFISEIGLNSKFELNDNDCPNFLKQLKQGKIINENIFTLMYKNSYGGNIIIGDNIYNIYKDKYNKMNFFKVNVIQSKNSIKWNINFDSVYIYDKFNEGNKTLSNKKNEGKIYLPSKVHINLKIDQKIIIGTLEYKNMIDNLYFNKLINSNICKYDIISYNLKNYYIFSCTAILFATFESVFPEDNYFQEPIYHYMHFPSLIFNSNSLKYSFELKYDELFILLGERYYFMIIFDADQNNNNNHEWIIGEHFIKKHIFSYNIKSKKIEFYNEEQFNENYKDDDNDGKEGNEANEKYFGKNNSDVKSRNKAIFIIVLLGICFSTFCFYLGIKIKERRKKRANELRDEYEYVSARETKNSINSINKTKQEVELNIQFLTQNKTEENLQ